LITDHTAQWTITLITVGIEFLDRKTGVHINRIIGTVNSFNLWRYDETSDETVEYFAHPTTSTKRGGGGDYMAIFNSNIRENKILYSSFQAFAVL
jgi:hypothetical protein